jgi:hypothetical protein
MVRHPGNGRAKWVLLLALPEWAGGFSAPAAQKLNDDLCRTVLVKLIRRGRLPTQPAIERAYLLRGIVGRLLPWGRVSVRPGENAHNAGSMMDERVQ